METQPKLTLTSRRYDVNDILEYESPIHLPGDVIIKTLHPWQLRAIDLYSNNWIKDPLLIGATGCGKCFVIAPTVINHLNREKKAKGLIAVPQNAIKKSFENLIWKTKQDGEIITFNCTLDENAKQIETLKEFLLKEPLGNDPLGRIKVATFQTIIFTLKEIRSECEANGQPMPQLFLWLDEAHHVCDGGQEDNVLKDKDLRNEIGNIILKLDQDKEKGIKHRIGRSTATDYRGDLNPTSKRKRPEDTIRFELSFPEYLETLRYIRGFTYSFSQYPLHAGPNQAISNALQIEQNYLAELKKDAQANKKEHTHKWREEPRMMWFLPKTKAKGRGVNIWKAPKNSSIAEKLWRANQIIEKYRQSLQKRHPKAQITTRLDWKVGGDNTNKSGCHLLEAIENNSLVETVRIANLVDDTIEGKKRRKRFVNWLGEDDGERPELDAIIALEMMKEGTNWTPVQAVVLIGPRNSVTEVSQINGRGMRDHPDKREVHFHTIVPIPDEEDKVSLETRRQFCDRYLQQLMGALLAQAQVEAFQQFKLKQKESNATGEKREKHPAEPEADTINKFFNEYPGIAEPRSEIHDALKQGWLDGQAEAIRTPHTEAEAEEIVRNACYNGIYTAYQKLGENPPEYAKFKNTWAIIKEVVTAAINKKPKHYGEKPVLTNLEGQNFVAQDTIPGIGNEWVTRFISSQFNHKTLQDLLKTIKQQPIVSYQEAYQKIKSFRIHTKQQYIDLAQKPGCISTNGSLPVNPERDYNLFWDSWEVFLDTYPPNLTKGINYTKHPQPDWSKNFENYGCPKSNIYQTPLATWWRQNQKQRALENNSIAPHQMQQLKEKGIICG